MVYKKEHLPPPGGGTGWLILFLPLIIFIFRPQLFQRLVQRCSQPQLHCIRHCIRVECAHRVRSHAYLLRDFDSSCCVSRMKSRVGVWCVFALVLAKQSGNGVGVKSGYVYSLSASLSGTQVFTSSVILETQALTSRLRLVLPALRGEVSQTGYT